MKLFLTPFLACLLILCLPAHPVRADLPPPGPLTLWYPAPGSPASQLNEGLPIGNSRIGGLIQGGTETEHIAVTEDSLWTGDENPSGNYNTMGGFQLLGTLLIHLPGHDKFSDYRRDLDLNQSLSHVDYQSGGVHFHREYFCSQPAGVMAVRLTADRPGSYTGSVELTDAHQGQVAAEPGLITLSGALANGLKYEAQLTAIADKGGTIQVQGNTLTFQNCDGLTLFFAAGTNYAMDYDKGYRGDDPHDRVSSAIKAAVPQNYDTLKAAHVADYQGLFNRVSLDLGASSADQKAEPTGHRGWNAAKVFDPELEQLLFQYGRYLLISCSRPGGLPANLQGLWNDTNNPEWHSDYHSNINIEMNYWSPEVTAIPECHVPLFDLIRSQLVPWRKATDAAKQINAGYDWATHQDGTPTTRGWALRTSHNIFGGMGWEWDKTANAWYCQHLWEHYAFGLDKSYLQNVAYPIIKEICEFWEDHLKTLPDGRLVVPNGWSPEHGPHEDGVSYNQEIVWDLFNNYVDAADALGIDPDYRNKVAGMRDKLVTPQIGKWGQLQEWMTDRDSPTDHHRHTSHLFGVYPGRQFSLTKTPDLARAAKVSLDARGDTGDVREWSYAWRTGIYARLHDGEGAHRELMHFFGTTSLNLFGNHPPVQLDGNFGLAATIPEMLLQSEAGEIEVLPALPQAWTTGSAKGLRARGGYGVNVSWENGKLKSVTLHNVNGGKATLRYGQQTVPITVAPGQSVTLDGNLK